MLCWFLPIQQHKSAVILHVFPSLPSPIPPFWEPQTCRGVVSSLGGLFHLTAQDPHESPLPCAALWHTESRNGSCYLCILWLLSWWLEAPSVELGRRSPQWDGTRSSSLSTEDATQQTGTRGASSGFPLCLLSPDSSGEQPHNKAVLSIPSASPSLLLVCGHHVLCVIVPPAQNLQWFSLLDTTRALDSLTLNPWNDHCWWLTFIYSLKFPRLN